MFLQILHGKPCGSIFDKLLVHAFKTPFSPFPLGVTFCRIGYGVCIEDAISFTLLVHTFAGTAGARSSITFIVSG